MLLDADVLDSQTIKKQDKNVKKNTGDDDIPWNTIYQVLDDENDWKSEDVDGLYPKIPKNERSIMRTGFGNNKFKENIVEPYPHIERECESLLIIQGRYHYILLAKWNLMEK